ncbi:hypothetical protein HDV06_004416 [Boothiomyces sp. JEL0866]|nr:hypothetical protein HDV06_004416 [Boothiomyces sp. JEL0866]
MTRDYNAYLSTSGVMLGMGLHNLASAAYILIAKASVARKTVLWILGLFAFLSLSGFLGLQVFTIDYISSPYLEGPDFLGKLFFFNYLLNLLTTIFITSLVVVRVRLFFGNSPFTYLMYVMGFFTVIGKGCGNAVGMYTSARFINGEYRSPPDDPLYPKIALIMAFALTFEAIFTAIGTGSFLAFLLDFDFSSLSRQNDVLYKEVLRLSLILFFNVLNAIFAVWIAFDDNWISHNGFFMDSLTYSLELYAFLELSYYNAKALVIENMKSKSSEKSRY